MRIKPGDQAVDFSAADYLHNEIRLNDYRKGKLLLSFYRYAGCPLCNLRMHTIINKFPEYSKAGLSIIAFLESPRESILRYIAKQGPPFPVIPDPDLRIYKMYGVEHSILKYLRGAFSIKLVRALIKGFMPGKMEGIITLAPADFLIENNVVIKAHYGKDISDHMPLEEIENFIK